jgi:hypothetical protein
MSWVTGRGRAARRMCACEGCSIASCWATSTCVPFGDVFGTFDPYAV